MVFGPFCPSLKKKMKKVLVDARQHRSKYAIIKAVGETTHEPNMTNKSKSKEVVNNLIKEVNDEILNNKNFRIKTNNPSNLTTVLKSDMSVFNTSLSILFLSRASNGKFEWRINGEQINFNTSTSVNQVNTGGFDIQNLCIRNDNDRAVSGEVREVIFYNEIALGDTQYQSKMVNLHNYLADKFDILIELTDLA